MNPLWDKARVQSLRRAVKQTSPQDWKASRARAHSSYYRLSFWYEKFWLVCGFFLLPFLLNLPFILDEPQKLPHSPASGMLVLNLFILSLFTTPGLFNHAVPLLDPLVNTPISGRDVYAYVLQTFRRETIWKTLVLLWTGMWALACTRLIVANTLTWYTLGQGLLCGLAIMSSCFVGACLMEWCARGIPYLRVILKMAGAVIVCWQGLLLFSKKLPGPWFLGDALDSLPQTQICLWLLDGPLPLPALLGCLAALPLFIFLVTYPLRDQPVDIPDDVLTDDSDNDFKLGAEAYSSLMLKEWRRSHHAHDSYAEGDWMEEELELSEEEADPDSGPLFTHETAPQEHHTPISAEFRQTIADRCHKLLLARGAECPLQDFLTPPFRSPRPSRFCQKAALLSGILTPLLYETHRWLPAIWQEKTEFWFFMAIFVPIVFSLSLTCHGVTLSSWALHQSNWMCLPVEPKVHSQPFFAHQRQLLRLRCLLALRFLVALQVTHFIVIAFYRLIETRGLIEQPSSVLTVWGRITIFDQAIFLFLALQVMRYLATMSFFGSFFHFVKWRGLARPISPIYALILLTSGSCLLAVFLHVLSQHASTLAFISQVLLWLALAELCHQLNIRLAFLVARRGRGDWAPGL